MKNILVALLAICSITFKSFAFEQSILVFDTALSVSEIDYTQEMETEETTTPATWVVVIQIELKRGTQFEINGQAVVLDRLREYYTMQLSVEDMQDLLGENYGAVLFAVENGDYSPDGEVAAALIAQAALRLGASGE